MSLRDQLNSYVGRLEKRLRLGAWFRGGAILTCAALITTLVLVLIANAFAFSRGSITGARIALAFALILAAAFGIALPLKALNRKRAAHQAEVTFPEFKQRLVTFAERDAAQREPFLELLAADTLEVARYAEPKRMVSDRKLLAFLGAGTVSLTVLLWMILAGPGFLGHGAALIWATAPEDAAPYYDLVVKPGDAAVRRSADQMVIAKLVGLETRNVSLYAKYQSGSKWEQVQMHPDPSGSDFEFVFAGLPENVEYYVEAGPLHSKHFHIRVLDLAAIKNIRVTYHYPDWAHLQSVTEEQGGDLRAVEGTEANLEILTDRPVHDGLLMVNDDQQIKLAGGAGNVYTATVHIDQDGVYHLAAMDQGQPVRLSNDYFIEAQKANPPEVVIARPGGDYRASPIEEVTVGVKASDDFGLNEMALHYSVNGGPEKTVDLLKQKGVKQADGSTVISLEDFKLVPGDLVSVYATAKDSRTESRSDMAFIQADPFERNFTQSQQEGGAGGGGGGGAGGQDPEISQREKEIIASTWKQRGDAKATKQQSADAAKFLSDVQSKLRDQARSLSGRMNSRELSQQNEEFNSFVDDMNNAAEAMGPAADKLKDQKWNDAIPDEEKALQHLLRAEATFRDIEVAFGSRGGAGGGGGAGRDLASLFDLELDTEKNQYETAQTANSQDQKQKEIDEALQKLDELARRQEELAQQPANNGSSSEQRWQQEMLRREAEQLQQQMEQMARNGSQTGSQSSSASGQTGSSGSQSAQGSQGTDPRVQQSLDRLKQATDDMRRATSPEEAEAAARRAADRLKEAQNLLGGIRQQETSSRLGALADETAKLSQEQQEQAKRMGDVAANGRTAANIDDWRKLADDRQSLATDLGNLQKQMQDAIRDLADNKQADAASKLRDALGNMQDSDLQTRIQRDGEWIRRGVNPNSNGSEDEITQGLQNLDRDVRNALQAEQTAPKPDDANSQQEGLETALNRVEQLRNQMNALSSNSLSRQPGAAGQQSGQTGQQGGQAGAGGPVGGGGANYGNGAYGGDNRGNYGGGYGGGVYWNFDTGNNTPVGGRAAAPDTTPIPPQQAYQESLRELNQLRQAVQQDPEVQKEIQALISQMQRLDPSRFPGNPALVEQLHTQVMAEVDNVELQLRRELDLKETGQVRSGDSRPVPAGYEQSVADYYRRLSSTK